MAALVDKYSVNGVVKYVEFEAHLEALRDAMAEEMRRDGDVFVMGEEVAEYQGAYKVTQGLLQEFGDKRVVDTPITEHCNWLLHSPTGSAAFTSHATCGSKDCTDASSSQ